MATTTRRGTLVVALLALASPAIVGAAADPAARDALASWAARILLVLAVAWVVIGALAARTRLVRRPGAAAARASWIAATRPWRARESTLGMMALDRRLLLLVPGALLASTQAVQTAFRSPLQIFVVLGGWALFLLVVRLVIRGRSLWPVVAAVGGVVVLRCIVTLLVLSWPGMTQKRDDGAVGAMGPIGDAVHAVVAAVLFVWLFVAAAWALSAQLGARRASGAVLAGVGISLAVPAAIGGLIGVERMLTLRAVAGEPVQRAVSALFATGSGGEIDVPPGVLLAAAGAGLVISAVGLVLAAPWRASPARRHR